MKTTPLSRLLQLPPYLFVRLNALKAQAADSGLDIVDLGQGSPDLPTPPHIVSALQKAAAEPWTHRYPQGNGILELRQAICAWYRKRFEVSLDPETEATVLIGSKEGLSHLIMLYLQPGDGALVPSPAYPVHSNSVLLAGGKMHVMPLKAENGFLPDLKAIPASVARKSKILILNYPNNPTGAAIEDISYLKKALDFAKKYGCLLLYDNAYSEIAFDGYRAPSILQIPGASKHAVEFHSLSKSFSMAGWRVGFAVGNAQVVGHLAKYKGFLDYGIPSFIQKAAAEALNGPQDCVAQNARTYQRRRDALRQALAGIGWDVPAPKASMYLWAKLPDAALKMGSLAFSEKLILQKGVVVAPGAGFGPLGEGYVRMSLVAPEERMSLAAERIGEFLKTL